MPHLTTRGPQQSHPTLIHSTTFIIICEIIFTFYFLNEDPKGKSFGPYLSVLLNDSTMPFLFFKLVDRLIESCINNFVRDFWIIINNNTEE